LADLVLNLEFSIKNVKSGDDDSLRVELLYKGNWSGVKCIYRYMSTYVSVDSIVTRIDGRSQVRKKATDLMIWLSKMERHV